MRVRRVQARVAVVISLIIMGFALQVAARDPFVMRVTTTSPSYAPGETMEVVVEAVYVTGSPVTQVKRTRIDVIDANGGRAARGALVNMGTGVLTYDYLVPDGAVSGPWIIKIAVADVTRSRESATITVEVTEAPTGPPEPTPTPTPSPTPTPTPPPDVCLDADGDGHEDVSCGGTDCDDGDPTILPGATEICGDGVDQDCNGLDLPCGDPHGGMTWNGPGTCLSCHTEEANQVHGSVMYQWQGATPDMVSGPDQQGKFSGAVNSYCINILGNWNVCGNCHVGLGVPPDPEPTQAQLENIDCMLCHQQAYRRTKVDGRFVPDEGAMSITMDEAARTVHRPERYNCLQCHAKAGGGDAVKRGDLSLAHVATMDSTFDVHMATTGANLRCQSCHTTTDHRVAGKGSDLRPTDSPVRVECTNCHADKASASGHDDSTIGRHVARVACQTCHIPTYAKDASDSAASEATEVHRTWLDTHSTAAPFHPVMDKQNDLMPKYRFWNRKSRNYLLHDVAEMDPVTGRYPTSRPLGDVGDPSSKLYPFKYKTAEQPITVATNQLIALDTSVFFATGNAGQAIEQGLANMGLSASEPYDWIETDTFQLLNHEVSPSGMALSCGECHGSTARMDLQGELGYGLKGADSSVCTQCHGSKERKSFEEIHTKHVKDKEYDCSWCHSFSRPERGLRVP